MNDEMTPELFHQKFPTARINRRRLVDWACPDCGSRGPFDIPVQAWAPLSESKLGRPYGPEDVGGRTMLCSACSTIVPRTKIEGLDAYLQSLAAAAPL